MIYVVAALSAGLGLSIYFNYMLLKTVVKQIIDNAEIEIPEDVMEPEEDTETVTIRVALVGGMAYWLADDSLMVAPVDDDGEIQYHLREPFNAFELADDEANMFFYVVDELKKGNEYEGGNRG